MSLFKDAKQFKPANDHNLFKNPPPIHTKISRGERLKPWPKELCLTEKQWEKLANWLFENYEHLESLSADARIMIALNGKSHRDPTELGKLVEECDLAKRLINKGTIEEAWKLATQRIKAVQS